MPDFMVQIAAADESDLDRRLEKAGLVIHGTEVDEAGNRAGLIRMLKEGQILVAGEASELAGPGPEATADG